MSARNFKRTELLKVSLVAVVAMLAACLLALVASEEPAEATFSGQNGKIAFSGFSDPNTRNIYTMNADGSELTDISNPDTHEEEVTNPVWSPDGTMFAFESARDGDREIYVMNTDGSNVTRLTDNEPVEDVDPAWSPDGTKIAFERSQVFVGREIYTMNADGSNVTRLTNNAFSDGEPAWGPMPVLANTAPVITSLRPPPGSSTTDRTPTIAATVTDQQTNLAKSNITLVLDDETIPRTTFSYNQSTDRMTYTSEKKISFGRHAVKVIALDGTGLSTTKRWSFEIVHP